MRTRIYLEYMKSKCTILIVLEMSEVDVRHSIIVHQGRTSDGIGVKLSVQDGFFGKFS